MHEQQLFALSIFFFFSIFVQCCWVGVVANLQLVLNMYLPESPPGGAYSVGFFFFSPSFFFQTVRDILPHLPY